MHKGIVVFFCSFSIGSAILLGFSAERLDVLPDTSIFKDTMVDMSWVTVKKEAEKGAIVLFPIGVVEEHGPHLDLSPDILLTVLHCRLIREHLQEKGVPVLIAPPYYWGMTDDTSDLFPGSFTVQPATFQALLLDTAACLKKWGFNKIFLVNLHGYWQHLAVLQSAAEKIREVLGIECRELSTLPVNVPLPRYEARRPGKFAPDFHAGAGETAEMWAFYPDRVNAALANSLKPQSSFAPLGFCGDPASFQLESGAAAAFKRFAAYDAEKILAFLSKPGH